jgi:hypothetical protein
LYTHNGRKRIRKHVVSRFGGHPGLVKD